MFFRTPLILFLFTSIIYSQDIDTTFINLQKKLDTASNQHSKYSILLNAGNYYFSSNTNKSEKLLLEAYKHLKDDNTFEKAEIHHKLGVLNELKGEFDKSYNYYSSAKKGYTFINDTIKIARTLLHTGYLHKKLNNQEKEIKHYKDAYKLIKHINDSTILGEYYDYMGTYCMRTNKKDSSLIYYQKGLKLFKNNKSKTHSIKNSLSVLFGRLNMHEKAIKIRQELSAYYKANKEKNMEALNHYNLACSYLKTNRYNTSLQYADSSLNIAKEEGFKFRKTKTLQLKSFIYADMKNYSKAYNHQLLYKLNSDSIYSNQKQKAIQELTLKSEFEIKEKELEMLAIKEAYRNKIYTLSFSIIIIIGSIISFFVFKSYKTKSEEAKEQLVEELEEELLNKKHLSKKVSDCEGDIKSLVADNTMRLEFTKQLFNQIKEDKKRTNSLDIKNYTNSLLIKLQQQINTENKFSAVQQKINDINQDFYKKMMLEHPTLTKSEREICAFLRLNLSIKEIASIRNVSIDSIKSSRYRIRKKLQIPKEEELEAFIQKINV